MLPRVPLREARAAFRHGAQRRRYVSAEQLTIVREKQYHLSKFAEEVEKQASVVPSRRSVEEQLDFGRQVAKDRSLLVVSARRVQDEILVRLARAIRSFQNLPYIFGINPRIQDVYVKCWDWFVQLHEWEQQHGKVHDTVTEKKFTEHLLKVFEDHGNVMHCLRQGTAEVRELPSSDSVDFDYVDKFLTRFIMRRMSWRVLAESHLAYRNPKGPQFNGIFNLECRPLMIGHDAFSKAQYICESELGVAPDYVIKGDGAASFEYIDQHLQYVLLELMKNSMRATVNHHSEKEKSGKSGKLPKVVMRICHGDEITISLHDRGGGVPRHVAERIWSYGFTTVVESKPSTTNAYFPGMRGDSLDIAAMAGDKALAGWGFGLPLSRCYVEYLGGTISIQNMPGYGCDTILTFPKLNSGKCKEQFDFA
eukprot:TRINITY_DN8765_c2_g1_i1.p1 TRINITY_DN8765_c2_g1~~TRINITY_DN8765_c2_g1_i1.p1  ORF type:complete len:422 (+),score=143.25 TRINITY_DN8765_c2_g1_i1:51-1316(+)